MCSDTVGNRQTPKWQKQASIRAEIIRMYLLQHTLFLFLQLFTLRWREIIRHRSMEIVKTVSHRRKPVHFTVNMKSLLQTRTNSTFINMWITNKRWTTGLTDIPSWNSSPHTSPINGLASPFFRQHIWQNKYQVRTGPVYTGCFVASPERACIDSNFEQSWPF
jgi:hypothetical protein